MGDKSSYAVFAVHDDLVAVVANAVVAARMSMTRMVMMGMALKAAAERM
jgi:hypothetical protein